MTKDTNVPRFFTDAAAISPAGDITISGGDARHITSVLRLRVGAVITVCDGAGVDRRCALTSIGRDEVTARVLDSRPSGGEPNINIALYQALPRGDKFEFIAQKCTEAGVRAITPFISERAQYGARAEGAGGVKLFERWRRIIYEAAKQSGRGIVPELRGLRRFADAADECSRRSAEAPDEILSLIAYELEEATTLKSVLAAFKRRTGVPSARVSNAGVPSGGGAPTVNVFIGPEGGFSQAEIEYCLPRQIIPATLGPRILRSETAGLAAVCQIIYEFE